MLVFGGYRFRIDSVMPSDALYSLDLNSRKWSILQPLPLNEVSFRFFFLYALTPRDIKICFVVLTFQTGSLFPIWPKRVCAAENMFFRNRVNIFRVKKEIACLKQGSELTDF